MSILNACTSCETGRAITCDSCMLRWINDAAFALNDRDAALADLTTIRALAIDARVALGRGDTSTALALLTDPLVGPRANTPPRSTSDQPVKP